MVEGEQHRRPQTIFEAYIIRCNPSSLEIGHARWCHPDQGKLRRAQSVVSQILANLEGQLGLTLFDRSARYPSLTEDGRALQQNARAVAEQVDGFKARAKTLREGLEPELSRSIDAVVAVDPRGVLVGAAEKAAHGRMERGGVAGASMQCPELAATG